MSRWLRVKSHFLFRVALGYLALVWLTALAIVVVFPMLGRPAWSITLAISLLLVGLPIVLIIAWVFGSSREHQVAYDSEEGDYESRIGLKVEHGVIAILSLTIAAIGVHQFLLEGSVTESTTAIEDQARLERVANESVVENRVQQLPIGIISPKEGSRSGTTGTAHENSILLAFDRLGPIVVGGVEFPIREIPYDDQGEPEDSRLRARQLVDQDNVLALLGPVNSGSTAAVVDELRTSGIDIPILTALSTAGDLIVSGRRDPNLFRVIPNDSRRMARLARYLEEERYANDTELKVLLAYDDDRYGRGLVRDLSGSLASISFERVAWCELVDDCEPAQCESEERCADQKLATSRYADVRVAENLDEGWVERFENLDFDAVVFLGTVPGSLAFAEGFQAITDRLDFGFVGSTDELFSRAPIGAFSVGNPALDPASAPTADLIVEWNELLSLFEERYQQNRNNFVMTAYEAASVLHGALRSVLEARQGVVPPVDVFRRELVAEIGRMTFPSLEPWRSIEFIEGELREPHTTPIFNIARGASRDDTDVSRPWVEIRVAPRFSYMEGPIRVELTGYGVDSARVTLFRIDGNTVESIRTREVDFSANLASQDFHVFRTGTFRISVEGNGGASASALTDLWLDWTYLISVVTAALGALVGAIREGLTIRVTLGRILLGTFAGFALTFSALYGADVAGWFPFPSFGDEPYVNAVVTGLIGGLVGPYVLAEAFLSWALTLTWPAHRRGAGQDIPEGL